MASNLRSIHEWADDYRRGIAHCPMPSKIYLQSAYEGCLCTSFRGYRHRQARRGRLHEEGYYIHRRRPTTHPVADILFVNYVLAHSFIKDNDVIGNYF